MENPNRSSTPGSLMRSIGLCSWLILAALFVALGCSSRQPPPPPLPHWGAPVVVDPAVPEPGYLALERETAQTLQTVSATQPLASNRPLNVLAVSGGGQYGSFAAGIMVGWTASGQRPEFDVVTGISSGALIAMFAFGGPKYDATMQHYFTTITEEDLFKYRPIPLNLIRLKAVASPEPMKRLVDREVTCEYLDDVRAAHQAGRRFYIGTMDINTKRFVCWDMGAIACSGQPDAMDTFKRIILASSSISGLVPPVPIPVEVNGCRHLEYHVDGGGVAQTFVRFAPHHPRPDPANPTARWLAGSNLYLIAGGKLYLDPIPGELSFVQKALGNISATLYALFRADAWRLYSLCMASGMRFHLASVPLDTPVHPRSTVFDNPTMRRLYAMGYDFAVNRCEWRHTPPGSEPGENEPPRAGTIFTVPLDPSAK